MSTPTLSGLLRENHRKQSEPRLKRKFLCWVGLFSMTPEVLAKFRVRAVFFVSADHLSLAWSKMKSWFPTSLPGSARSIRWDGEKTLPGMQRPRPKRPPVLQCHCPTPRHLLQTIKTSLHFLNNFFCVPKESVFTLDNLGTFFRKDYIRKKKSCPKSHQCRHFCEFPPGHFSLQNSHLCEFFKSWDCSECTTLETAVSSWQHDGIFLCGFSPPLTLQGHGGFCTLR